MRALIEIAARADDEIARLHAENAALRAEVEKLREDAERDAAVAREVALAKECVEAWENAVDWASYASEYFREKHGAEKDQDRLDNARDRLVMLEIRAQADQPEGGKS